MAITVVSFRWLEILEKEFDKNFVDLDLLIGDLDGEEPDLVYSARQKLAGLSSCFAQLTHKAQTIFQNSAKTEAELVDLRAELVQCKARQEVLEEESRNLVLQLHSLQLDRLPSNQNPEQYKEKIDNALKLSPSKGLHVDDLDRNRSEMKRLRLEAERLHSENRSLRDSVLALHSEVFGARLAAKYLDKELAGRIQQLQLLGKEMRSEVRDRLWRQLESEILLHRHKTVIRACRNRPQLAAAFLDGVNNNNSKALTNGHSDEVSCSVGEKRTVILRRERGQGLGISITGGREHGVPILISELEEGGPAHQCKGLFVGDAILKVDETSLESATHLEAVKVLTSLTGTEIQLVVQFIAVDTDDETSFSEDLYGYRYRFFDSEVMDSSAALGLHPMHQVHQQQDEKMLINGDGDDQLIHESSVVEDTPPAPRTPENSSRDDEDVSALIDLHTVCQQSVSQETAEKEDEINESFSVDILSLNDSPKAIRMSPVKSFKRTQNLTMLPSKLPYLDETIFSGLEDTSLLDNIVKSFSEEDWSGLEVTSDSGLEVGGGFSINRRSDVTVQCAVQRNAEEKVELKTLQHIFDRSFSSTLSSPRESTSFDEDIFSTEHSDEKTYWAAANPNGGAAREDIRNRMNELRSTYNPKKFNRTFEEGKKSRRGKVARKLSREGREVRDVPRIEKRRSAPVCRADRFDESLLEYTTKKFEEKEDDLENALEATRLLSLQYGLRFETEISDTQETSTDKFDTKQAAGEVFARSKTLCQDALSRKSVEGANTGVAAAATTAEAKSGPFQIHFRQANKKVAEDAVNQKSPTGLRLPGLRKAISDYQSSDHEKSRPRNVRFDSFGDPDFGTPV